MSKPCKTVASKTLETSPHSNPSKDAREMLCTTKGRTPAGFVPKPLRNCSQKNYRNVAFGTHTKKKQKDGKPAGNQAKPKKKVFGERMRKSRTPAGFVPKPCKTVARKTLETSPTKRTILKDSKTSKTSPTERQNPRKRSLGSACEKAEPQQVSCLNHAKP